MKGSFRLSCLALGSVALVIAAACSKSSPPPAQPPTYEPLPEGPIDEPGTPEQQPGAEPQGAPGAQGMGPDQAGTAQGQPGAGPGAQGAQGAQGSQGAPSAQAELTEAQICTDLGQIANVRVEDMTNGAAVIFTPKNGTDMGTVRQSVQQIEPRLQPSGQAAPQGARCALFEIGRMGGTAVIQETPTALRLLFTAPDKASVEQVRRHARDFASAKGPQGR